MEDKYPFCDAYRAKDLKLVTASVNPLRGGKAHPPGIEITVFNPKGKSAYVVVLDENTLYNAIDQFIEWEDADSNGDSWDSVDGNCICHCSFCKEIGEHKWVDEHG